MSCKFCCAHLAENEQSITCQGFCLSTFHRTCAGLTLEDFICWNRSDLIWWMCGACSKMMTSIRQRDSLLAEREKFEPESAYHPSATDSAVEDQCSKQPSMQDVMDEITVMKQQISALHDNVSARIVTDNERISETSVPMQHSPLSSTRLQHGSRLYSSANLSLSRDTGERFWMFFTRIKSNVTEEQMLNMVCESLQYSSSITPVVKKFVPPWKDASLMPYISFKIGIDPMMKTAALLPSTWPKNISFREFYNHLHVWEPTGRR